MKFHLLYNLVVPFNLADIVPVLELDLRRESFWPVLFGFHSLAIRSQHLRSARMEHGVLVIFGVARFEIRKLIMPEGGYQSAELVLKPGGNDNPNHP